MSVNPFSQLVGDNGGLLHPSDEIEAYMADPVGCVARGAALLDARRPGWYRDINVSTLDMRSPYLCVFGQLYGYWTTGLYQHALHDVKVFSHGICGNPALLRAAWEDAITARRLADHESDVAATERETVNV